MSCIIGVCVCVCFCIMYNIVLFWIERYAMYVSVSSVGMCVCECFWGCLLLLFLFLFFA